MDGQRIHQFDVDGHRGGEGGHVPGQEGGLVRHPVDQLDQIGHSLWEVFVVCAVWGRQEQVSLSLNHYNI